MTGFVCQVVSGERPDNFHAGYIIIGGDTLNGFILFEDHFSNSKQCVFKESKGGLTKTYSPDDLIGYGVEGKYLFYAADIQNGQSNGPKVFLECIVKSNINLFFYRDRFFVKSENGLEELVEVKEVVKRDGKAFTVKRPLYKSVLQKQMNDCSFIHEKIAKTTLTKKGLLKLFNDYAACTGHEAIVFESGSEQTTKVRFGAGLGVLVADLNLKSDANYRYTFGDYGSGDPSVSFTPSFFVELGMSSRFDVCTGLNWYFTKNNFHAESPSANLVNDFSLEASRIEVPLLFKYALTKGNIKWSLKAGCGFNGVIKYDSRLIVSTSSGYVLDEYNNDLKKNSFLVNGMGGVCAEFLLGNRSFSLEGDYSKSGSIVQSGTYAGFSGVKFSVGMFF
ncbi:MAG TPA: outer membrane beta-barrel protein [Cyclobacteriaceae bacterium]|nr:outer membrane beta-barrel protein [Cyclobacteriaceae bacterium]